MRSASHAPYETFLTRGYSFRSQQCQKHRDAYILQGRLRDAIDLCHQAIERCNLSVPRIQLPELQDYQSGLCCWNEMNLRWQKICPRKFKSSREGPIRNDFGQGHASLH
jgi:hypothetical protein